MVVVGAGVDVVVFGAAVVVVVVSGVVVLVVVEFCVVVSGATVVVFFVVGVGSVVGFVVVSGATVVLSLFKFTFPAVTVSSPENENYFKTYFIFVELFKTSLAWHLIFYQIPLFC